MGARARSLRLAAGLTLEQVAGAAEGDFRHLQRIEAGQINVTLATLLRLARALGVPAHRLLGSEPAEDEEPLTSAAIVRDVVPHGPKSNIKYASRPPDVEAVTERAGARLRAARIARRMTQRQAAEAAGITVQHLQRVERGAQNATLKTLLRAAAAVGVELDAVLAPPGR